MIVTFISLFLLVVAFAAALWLYVSTKSSPLLYVENVWLTKEEIGRIEEQLSNCREVILVADKVNVPTREDAKEIMIALIDNFIDGVEYNFLVPKDYYQNHNKEIISRYKHIMGVAEDFSESDVPPELFKLHAYPYEKLEPDYPYLFYRYETEVGDEIIAYRGEDVGMGIASHYRRLEPEIARTFLLKMLPYIHGDKLSTDINKYDNFSSENVIPIERQRKQIEEVI